MKYLVGVAVSILFRASFWAQKLAYKLHYLVHPCSLELYGPITLDVERSLVDFRGSPIMPPEPRLELFLKHTVTGIRMWAYIPPNDEFRYVITKAQEMLDNPLTYEELQR